MAGVGNNVITPQSPFGYNAVTTVANSDRTDTAANAVLLMTAGPNGARISSLTALARATVTATELQLFRSLDAGTTKRYFKSKLMAAFTLALTTQNNETDFGYSDVNPLILGPNEKLYCAIGVALAGGIVFQVQGGDY